ncbi:YybH family protein [Sphingopyxis sp.]|uniref:YybH family protein n=1 Tax=Sphingopyxis sp. TaxID=1908224 RepID=UPI003F6FB226
MRGFTMAAIGLALVMAAPVHAAAAPDYQTATATLAQYKQAIENRDLSGVDALFAPDAQIFESGGIEGNFAHYRDHHLAPELKAFKSFAFKDYKISVRGEGEVAVATETYNYTIVLTNGETIERAGVATSVLKWTNGKWQIISLHSSSRKPKA